MPNCLACPVRDCGLPLERRDRVFVCPNGHSHDIARRGYINLLQPQDRRSRHAGDSKESVQARIRLLESGIGRPGLDAVVARAAALPLDEGACVADLGCGSGELLTMLAALRPIAGVGIDLSAAAIERAARWFPELTWVVANADRRLPLLEASVSLVISMNGRRNPAEAARVLRTAGFLLIAVPAADDLIELRELVQGQAVERSRAEGLIAEHEALFHLLERSTTRERRLLERDQLRDVLRGTYRGGRTSAAARLDGLTGMEVTLASDMCLFERR
jgi:23S rRNA (guanine745-N1)-methyltransferase